MAFSRAKKQMKCKNERGQIHWFGRAIAITAAIALSGCSQDDNAKKVVGETAQISLTDGNIDYLARIDTGARITSVHALDMEVAEGSPDKKDNIGKLLTFNTVNEKGESKPVTAKIIDVAKVRNAQGVEYRYVVELNLNWQGMDKSVHVNLRDRSAMSYKLLIGRNWLSDDFVVDVNKSEGIIK